MDTVRLPTQYHAAFKDADIRGVYPGEINEVVVYRVGRSLPKVLQAKQVVVARDMRCSSPQLHRALIAGIRDSGGQVWDLGLVPTTAMYYATGVGTTWGVMVTASHNPADYNGLKIVKPGAEPLTNASGMKEVQRFVRTYTDTDYPVVNRRGEKRTRQIIRTYVRAMERQIPLPVVKKPVRIVADAGNGMASMMLAQVKSESAYTIEVLNPELDGTFPVRASNPMLRKNQRPIKHALKTGKYDLGVSFDGDGDRVAFFLPNGQMLNGAVVGAMLAEQMLQTQPGATFIDTVFNSLIYRETIKRAGGKVKTARVGHAFIKEQMRKHQAIFACEHSGHCYFQANYFADSAILAMRYMIKAILQAEGDVKTAVRHYLTYHQTEEILITVPDKNAVMTAVAEKYQALPDAVIAKFDGVSVDQGDVWFTVKPSVTEDALKFVVESKSTKRAKAVQSELHQFLQTHAS